MGSVYLASPVGKSGKVAIKVLHRTLLENDEFVERFLREAEIATRIQHENCVKVFECQRTASGELYLVMEYLAGRSLEDFIRDGRLTLSQVLSVSNQIAAALQAAHQLRVVHRDLKPENIIVLEQDPLSVRVLDFGIAKNLDADVDLTKAGQIFGTPEYMSPEQCQGRAVDQRSDLYSLGCILFELLAGRPPFEGGNPMTVIISHLNDEIPPLPRTRYPNVSTTLERLVARLLAKEPEFRIRSVDEVLRILRSELHALDRLNPASATVAGGRDGRSHRDSVWGSGGQVVARSPDGQGPMRSTPVNRFEDASALPIPGMETTHSAHERGEPNASPALERNELGRVEEGLHKPLPSLDTLEGAKHLPSEGDAGLSQDETLVREVISRPVGGGTQRIVVERKDPSLQHPAHRVPWEAWVEQLRLAWANPGNRLWIAVIAIGLVVLVGLLARLI